MDPIQLLELPAEILLRILRLVLLSNSRDILSLSRTCLRLRAICQDQHLWTRVRLVEEGRSLLELLEFLEELPTPGEATRELDIDWVTPSFINKVLRGCPELEVLHIRVRNSGLRLRMKGLPRLRLLSISSSLSVRLSTGRWIEEGLRDIVCHTANRFPSLPHVPHLSACVGVVPVLGLCTSAGSAGAPTTAGNLAKPSILFWPAQLKTSRFCGQNRH